MDDFYLNQTSAPRIAEFQNGVQSCCSETKSPKNQMGFMNFVQHFK